MKLKVIAHIRTDFSGKFGVPRQSGLVASTGKIFFEPEYRIAEAFKGLEGYSHLWIIWQFSENEEKKWSPTVRPPRLGGNKRIGVFATRSPFRPNALGLSSVELAGIEYDEEYGPVIIVKGADMVNNTPIFDIKPYLAYTDSHNYARGGFSDDVFENKLKADIPEYLFEKIPDKLRQDVISILENDPRPSYHNDPERVYGMSYAGLEIKFAVKDGLITVSDIYNIS